MTSYPFLKMAAAAAQYCFRFCICWCHCLQKVKVYQHTKFRRHILVHGWDITTSCLEKQPSTILEFYLRFRCQPFRRNRRVILHQGAEFLPNRTTHCGIMTSYRFSRWRPSAMLYLLWGNGGPPTKCISWSELGPEIFVRRINTSGDIAMYKFWRFGLKLPIHAHFGGIFGGIFSQMTSPVVLTPKRTVFGRKHVVWAI